MGQRHRCDMSLSGFSFMQSPLLHLRGQTSSLFSPSPGGSGGASFAPTIVSVGVAGEAVGGGDVEALNRGRALGGGIIKSSSSLSSSPPPNCSFTKGGIENYIEKFVSTFIMGVLTFHFDFLLR